MRRFVPLLLTATLAAQAGTITALPPFSAPQRFGSTVGPTLAFDVARNRGVLVVGMLFGSGIETWEYDGATWTQLSQLSTNGPSVYASKLAYDEQRQHCELATSTGFTLYLSEWANGAWQPIAATPLPTPQPGGLSIGLVRDPIRARTLIILPGSPASAFEFDGVQLVPAPTPPPFAGSPVFDFARGQIIAVDSGAATWSYDGVAWRNLQRLAPARVDLAADATLQRVLALTSTGLVEWNGLRWRDGTTVGASLPSPPCDTLAFDAAGDALLVRLATNGNPGMTLRYRELTPVSGSFARLGTGCPGPLGVMQWVPPGDPPRFARTLLCVLTNVPDGAANVTLGIVSANASTWNGQPLPLSLGPLGAPGCNLFVEPQVVRFVAAFQQRLTWLLPMPTSPGAVGQDLHLQTATLVPGFNALSMITSDAATLHIGTR